MTDVPFGEIIETLAGMRQVAATYDATPQQVALAWQLPELVTRLPRALSGGDY